VTVKQFVIDEFLPDVGVDQLDPDYDLMQGGVVDSIGLLKLIAWLEHRFNIAADDIDLDPDNFRSVTAIDRFIELCLAGQAEAN
jgi:acyl carrier protein